MQTFEEILKRVEHNHAYPPIVSDKMIYEAMEEAARQAVNECKQGVVMPSLPIDRWDAEEWLGKNKDIWNHPRITDRNDKESYEVADLMAEYANWLLGNGT